SGVHRGVSVALTFEIARTGGRADARPPSDVRAGTPRAVTWITARHGPSDHPVVQGGALLTGASTTAGEGQAVACLAEGFRPGGPRRRKVACHERRSMDRHRSAR